MLLFVVLPAQSADRELLAWLALLGNIAVAVVLAALVAKVPRRFLLFRVSSIDGVLSCRWPRWSPFSNFVSAQEAMRKRPERLVDFEVN
jgi:hypothetical protein